MAVLIRCFRSIDGSYRPGLLDLSCRTASPLSFDAGPVTFSLDSVQASISWKVRMPKPDVSFLKQCERISLRCGALWCSFLTR